MTRRGLFGGQYKPINDEDVRKIHETTLRVFSEVGVQVNFPAALELFREAGASVDESSRLVKVPGAMVEELVNQRRHQAVKKCLFLYTSFQM